MKHLFGFLCCALQGVCFSANALVILQYHHISDETPKSTSTSPELFGKHLDYLDRHDFKVIGLDKVAELIRSGEALPDKTAAITFDDGYISVYQQAWPRLKKHGFPFAVFINTQPHDAGNPHFMSWQQMQEMSGQGVIFANHTVSHPHLIRRKEGESPLAWKQRVWDEIKTAEDILQQKLQQDHRLFAYPYGEYSTELKKLLADKGYLAFGQQSGPVFLSSDKESNNKESSDKEFSDRQAVPRFPFGGVYGAMDSFVTKVNTRPMPLSQALVLTETGSPLEEPELPDGVTRPQLVLTFSHESLVRQVSCFASGQGSIPVQINGTRAIAQAPKALPVGRSRYNCTAPTGEAGHFYWYSRMFIRRQDNGRWYDE